MGKKFFGLVYRKGKRKNVFLSRKRAGYIKTKIGRIPLLLIKFKKTKRKIFKIQRI